MPPNLQKLENSTTVDTSVLMDYIHGITFLTRNPESSGTPILIPPFNTTGQWVYGTSAALNTPIEARSPASRVKPTPRSNAEASVNQNLRASALRYLSYANNRT